VTTTLPNGHYRTKAGSTVRVYGKHSGYLGVYFDWFEEPDACCDCVVHPYPEDWGDGTHRLTWKCDVCGGGSAVLELVPAADDADSAGREP
jgi:hypothetical protein